MVENSHSPNAGTSRRRLLQAGSAAGLFSILGPVSDSTAVDVPAQYEDRTQANVNDFGATGDGHTDDTAAFAAAIDSLPGGGGVLIPNGTYAVQQIRLKRRIVLQGQGWRSTLLQMPDVSGALIVLDDVNVEFTRVSSLMLNGNKAQQSQPNAGIGYLNDGGVFSFYDSNHIVDNVLILNTKGHGLRLSLACREAKVSNVYVLGPDASGFSIGSTDCTFTTCTVGGAGLSGWDLLGPNNKFVSCKGFGNGRLSDSTNDSGFLIRQSRQNLANCEAQDNGGHGFWLQGVVDVTMATCIADSNGSHGVNTSGFSIFNSTMVSVLGFQSLNRTGKATQRLGLEIAGTASSIIATGTCHDNLVGDFAGSLRYNNIYLNSQARRFGLTAPPTTGTATVGEVVVNSAVAAGTTTGWICTVAGTPGTWVALAKTDGPPETQLPPASGLDDTIVLNAALTAAAGKVIVGRTGSAYLISAPLVLDSNTTLDMTGCTVTLRSGANCNMVQNRAVATVQRTVSDGVSTSPDVLSSGTAAFTAADVGRTVVVQNADTAGNSLSARIVQVLSGSTVRVSDVLAGKFTGCTVNIYDRDSNIAIYGGLWDRGANVGTGRDAHTVVTRRCDRLNVGGVAFRSMAGRHAVNLGDVRGAQISDLTFDQASDGIHVHGPASTLRISNCSGALRGDVVSLATADPAPFNDVQGVVLDVKIDGIDASTPTGTLVKLAGSAVFPLSAITVNRLSGTAKRGVWVAEIGSTGRSILDGLRVETVSVHLANATGAAAVDLSTGGGTKAVVRGVVFDGAALCFGLLIGSWARVEVSDLSVVAPAGVPVVLIRTVGAVRELRASALKVVFGETMAGAVLDVLTGSALTHVLIDDVQQTSGRCLLSIGGTVATITIRDANVTRPARLANIGTSTELTLAGLTLDSPAQAAVYVSGTAQLLLRGSNIQRVSDWAGLQRQAAQVVRCTNPDLPVDVSLLARAPGDQALNINAALPCGTGRVMTDGAAWRNVFSGNKY
ncbi:hypothetical protein ABIB25_005466 [Nakamurella sp. UYEF19]|uniref:right-handed parallel beta-helix repeat-containing protein n=1 Tax=Nakamurella sp. UYEF19 TaxID=1756392 RepID=UPI0033908340